MVSMLGLLNLSDTFDTVVHNILLQRLKHVFDIKRQHNTVSIHDKYDLNQLIMSTAFPLHTA